MEKISRQESQYARSLIEASLDPLFTISPEGKITDINNASIDITEVTRENLIGTDFFEYFTEPDKAREIYKQVFTEDFVADFPLTIRDGKLTEVLFNGSVYKDEHGKVIGVVVVARDITDHNRIEKELKEAKMRAESATKIAEDAVKSKQQFLSNMSHEIRTPMKKGMYDKDWDSVYAAAHKLIPSFSIMGLHKDFEDAAKKIQEYSNTHKHLEEIQELVLQIENVCSKACEELEEELNLIKKSK